MAVINSQLIGTGNPPNGKFIGGTYRSSQNPDNNLFVCNKSRADGKTIQEQPDPNITQITSEPTSSNLWKQLDFNIGEDDSANWQQKEGSLPCLTSIAKQTALAASDKPREKKPIFKQGSGTYMDPFIINNKEQLQAMRQYPDAFFKLNTHITLSNEDFAKGGAFFNDGKGWQPIGTEEEPFSGGFNAQGFIIKNLQIKTTTYLYPIGFFGTTSGANIEGVTLSCNISYTSPLHLNESVILGGLIGKAYNSSVKNCKIAAKIFFQTEAKQNSSLGIFAGSMNNTHIEQCTVIASSLSSNITVSPSAPLTENEYQGINIGGLIGDISSTIVKDSSVSATLNVTYDGRRDPQILFLGGFIGVAQKSSSISRCAVSGNIEGNATVTCKLTNDATSIGGMLAVLKDSKLCDISTSNSLNINLVGEGRWILAGCIAHLKDSAATQIIAKNPSLKAKVNTSNQSYAGALIGQLTKENSSTMAISGALLIESIDLTTAPSRYLAANKINISHLTHACGAYAQNTQSTRYNIQCLASSPLIEKMQKQSNQRDAARAWRQKRFYSTNSSYDRDTTSKDDPDEPNFIIYHEIDPKDTPQQIWVDLDFKFGKTEESPWIWESNNKAPSLYNVKQ